MTYDEERTRSSLSKGTPSVGSNLAENQTHPSARSDDLLIEQLGDETIVYDLKSKDVHCLSPLAAGVFRLCDGNHTRAQMTEVINTGSTEPVSEDAVYEAVAQLQERHLLDVPPMIIKNNGDGISRRDFGKRSAVAGAAFLAVPLISSIAAPTAMAGASQLPSGCSGCGTNHDCLSNHCCQDVAGKSCNQTCCVQHDNSCHITASGVCTVILDVPADCVSVDCPPNHPKCCCCDQAADIAKGCPACPT
jgi:hypothetical protein